MKSKQQFLFTTDNEDISTDGAVVLLEKLERKHKLIKHFSNQLIDNRDQSKIEYSHFQMLKQRVFLMAQGYEDCNDQNYLPARQGKMEKSSTAIKIMQK